MRPPTRDDRLGGGEDVVRLRDVREQLERLAARVRDVVKSAVQPFGTSRQQRDGGAPGSRTIREGSYRTSVISVCLLRGVAASPASSPRGPSQVFVSVCITGNP
jgi:hypothetical protein